MSELPTSSEDKSRGGTAEEVDPNISRQPGPPPLATRTGEEEVVVVVATAGGWVQCSGVTAASISASMQRRKHINALLCRNVLFG